MRIDWTSLKVQKILDPRQIPGKVAELRKQGRTIATLNGSFDLMHAGHLHILFSASQQADILIVGLNTDQSVQSYKSPDRPIISLQYRLDMLLAIACVDYVTWFDETDPRQLLDIIRPDVHVNGAEYGDNCIEAEVVMKNGGKVHLVDRIPGLATSAILSKILELQSKG